MGYLNSALHWLDDLGNLPLPSLLLVAGVVLLIAVVLAARWVIRHPDRMLVPVRWLRARPAVARLEHRYARQLRSLVGRLYPKTSAGLTLVVGIGAVVLLVATLSEITEDVVTGDELVQIDSPVSRYLREHREPWLTTTMGVITDLGSTVVLVPVLLAVGFVAHRRRHTWAPMVFLALTLSGATLTSTIIKLAVARDRPGPEALVQALGYAFPSGHSTAATAGWLAIAVVLAWLARNRTVGVSLLATALVVAVLVGISRVYLGVHHFTDVLAGWSLGALWLTVTLAVVHLLTFGRR
ncbi:MAG: phosphatase PAP2 family protein [Pseudonocardiaceae bacterium]